MYFYGIIYITIYGTLSRVNRIIHSQLKPVLLFSIPLMCLIRSRLRRPVQDGSSVVTNHSNSPLSDTEVKTQRHYSDPNPCSYSSPPCMDSLITVKQEYQAEISEMSGEETDIHWDAKYVSTGVQSSRNLKIEDEEGRIILSPQPKEGYWLDKMVKGDPDGAGQDSTVFSANQKGDSTDIMTTPLNSREYNTILLSEEQC